MATMTHPVGEHSTRSPAAVIRTNKVSKTFSLQGHQQHVLKNLDLDIHRGDFTVIMGPSGAGKSTLLYCLSGMDQPSLGAIEFSGVTITDLTQDRLATFRRRHCGFVFQQVNLLDNMSILDNVMAPGLLLGERRQQVLARAQALFDQVGLDAAAQQKFPGQLSGGEGQRAGIVRALINQPDVVFADEPTGQLNSHNSARVLDLLAELHEHGQTIVMVTHDLRSALRGSRILYLRDGSIRGELGLEHLDEPHREAALTSFLSEMGW